jgi:hypothetical protein
MQFNECVVEAHAQIYTVSSSFAVTFFFISCSC